jgi:hypothetical protein
MQWQLNGHNTMTIPINDPGNHWHKDNIDDDYYEIPGVDYPCYDEHSDEKTLYSDLNWKPITRDYNDSNTWDDNDIPF